MVGDGFSIAVVSSSEAERIPPQEHHRREDKCPCPVGCSYPPLAQRGDPRVGRAQAHASTALPVRSQRPTLGSSTATWTSSSPPWLAPLSWLVKSGLPSLALHSLFGWVLPFLVGVLCVFWVHYIYFLRLFPQAFVLVCLNLSILARALVCAHPRLQKFCFFFYLLCGLTLPFRPLTQ